MLLPRLDAVLAKTEDFLSQGAGPLGRARDLAQVTAGAMVLRQSELSQLDGTNDGSECVLDLVRELARHGADRLEALRVQHLILTRFAFVDFAKRPDAILA